MSVRSWRSPDGQPATAADGKILRSGAFHVAHNVNPGQLTQLRIVSPTPPRPGPYQLILDMISYNVGWFADLAEATPPLCQ